ncbi:10070_t:CDS:2 [Acaulospora colombiana]|uniref:10070_t:CDS:1 n=1 Tax=Acaulospora colombiana TaxID=27376 RepID=A0ACA9LQ36_9GLOM|nr:10070_t:CDS:2 [Acaulospora colombiana]
MPKFKVHIVGKDKAFVWDAEGIVTLINEEGSHRSPTNSQIEVFNKQILENEGFQLQKYLHSKEEKKKMIKLARKEKHEHENSESKENEQGQNDDTRDYAQDAQRRLHEDNLRCLINEQSSKELPKRIKTQTKGFVPAITIKTKSDSFAWYDDNAHGFDSLEAARKSNFWTWPQTEKEEHRYKVFCDLWKKGYYITSGVKFGGDYLLYSDDPLRQHSHFIATILDMNRVISPLDIVTFGRLGTAVKKSYMLCSWDQNLNKPTYVCVEWAGF